MKDFMLDSGTVARYPHADTLYAELSVWIESGRFVLKTTEFVNDRSLLTNSERFVVFAYDGEEISVDKDGVDILTKSSFSSYLGDDKARILLLCANTLASERHVSRIAEKIGYIRETEFKNILPYLDRLDDLESLGPVILSGLHNHEFNVQIGENGRKRAQKLGLPAAFIAMVENRFPTMASSIVTTIQNSLSEGDNGNDIVEFGKWLELYYDLSGFTHFADQGYDQYVDYVCKIHSASNLRYSEICEYIARQDMKYCPNVLRYGYAGRACNTKQLCLLPVETAREYCDYIVQMQATETKPSNMWVAKAHLALRHNVTIQPWQEEAFAVRANELSFLNTNIEGYGFAVPQSYRELVDIGATFHNCLPSCGPVFISGNINIVFVTKPDEATPAYALEVGKDGRLLQVKQDHDLEVTDSEALRVIGEYGARVRQALRSGKSVA